MKVQRNPTSRESLWNLVEKVPTLSFQMLTVGKERIQVQTLFTNSIFSLVDYAVKKSHDAIMFNMGQVCTAGSRTFVHESIYDEFVKKSVELANKRTVGDPFDPTTENGAQVNYHSESICTITSIDSVHIESLLNCFRWMIFK